MVALKGERTGLLFDYWFLFSSIGIPLFPALIFPYFPHCFFLILLLPIVFCIF